MKPSRLVFPVVALALAPFGRADDLHQLVAQKVNAEYPALFEIYKDLHQHPELSFMEVRTAGIVAKELRALGFEVTEKVGGLGVVGVMKNGAGPTVFVRADMDALPVKEETGLPYASTAVTKDFTGQEFPTMHACGHDSHVTALLGTARTLAALKDRWSGTLVLFSQHAEEAIGGARAMLQDGLFTRFPHPDFVIAFHTLADLPAGQVACIEGPAYANVDSVDITVRGYGGHGSRPHTTRDPVVLAAEIVGMLQTIVSRELKPGTPAVVTVGTIHGGTRRNIIPDEVKLELTIRSYDEAVADQIIAAIKRICLHAAEAAGVPADRMPVVNASEYRSPVVVNDVALARRLNGVFRAWFGEARVPALEPATYGEDFAEYGRTRPKVPVAIISVGGTDPVKWDEAKKTGAPLPGNHSALFAPLPEPTLKTGVTASVAAALELLAKK
ncbi:MAG: amidohydrolase [Opitutae bacterium]|nr:amidohydrolase [Opitutae bacterium]